MDNSLRTYNITIEFSFFFLHQVKEIPSAQPHENGEEAQNQPRVFLNDYNCSFSIKEAESNTQSPTKFHFCLKADIYHLSGIHTGLKLDVNLSFVVNML